MTTFVLVEDHHIVRQGFKALLAADKNFSLLGEASDGLEALEVVNRCKPNVLLLDLMIPRLHGLEVLRRLRASNCATHVIVLSLYADEAYVVEAFRCGALGYVLKDCCSSNLIEAMRTVAAGKRYLSPVLTERALDAHFRNPDQAGTDPLNTLTERERHVFHLVAEGVNNMGIGKKLFISPRTVESHRQNLMRKLGLRSHIDLVRFAIRKKVIEA